MRVSSRRGAIVLRVQVTENTTVGVVFIPFHFSEAAANLLTIDALDPNAKIPEFKVCAVKINAVEQDELLKVIKSVTGKLPEVKYTPARRIDVPENVLDVGKIKSALNWSPKTSLYDGIEETWKWLKERGGKR